MKRSLYWLSDDEGREVDNLYYKRDAIRAAKMFAKRYKCDIYINCGDEIVDVVFAPSSVKKDRSAIHGFNVEMREE